MFNKKVLIITTGGTILSQYNPELKCVTPGLNGCDLAKFIHFDHIQTHVEEFINVPGPHLDMTMAVGLSRRLEEAQTEYDGIVVLQGTDTLEEFSYLIHLMTRLTKPVVFTGAMKGFQDYYSDAIGNIHSAISVAGSMEAKDRGLMVVFNERIYDPREVYKKDTSHLDAFGSTMGPIGQVTHGKVYFFRPNKESEIYQNMLEPNVDLFKIVLGGTNKFLDQAIDEGVKGIVLEAFGAGNIPPHWAGSLERAIAKKIPVVITSRCPIGSVQPVYDYVGGGKSLGDMGAIFAYHLSAPKARIKLMVLLGQRPNYSIQDISEHFYHVPMVPTA